MATINPHFNFNGNALEAFEFYRSVFGGEFSKVVRFKDMVNAGYPIPEHEFEKIMHISLPIGNSGAIMGNDVPEMMGKTNENENRAKIVVNANSKNEALHIFEGLSAGGQIEMPIQDSPWNTFFGMFRDKFGIEWMVEFDPNQQP